MSIQKRNIYLIYVITFLINLQFFLPIWIIFGTEELGFSVKSAVTLMMIMRVFQGVFEIPTGSWADKYGRRYVFLAGSILWLAFPLAYLLKLSPMLIFVTSLLPALGLSLQSGTLMPLAKESVKNSQHKYSDFLSNQMIVRYAARIMGGFSGGALYVANPSYPYLAVLAAGFMTVLATIAIVDHKENLSKLSSKMHILETAKIMKSKEAIVLVISMLLITNFVSEAVWLGYQELYKSDGLNTKDIGLIFSGIATVSIFGTFTVKRLIKHMGVYKIRLIITLCFLATPIMLYIPNTAIRIAAFAPMSFGAGMALVPITAIIQKYVPPKHQSTALSIFGLLRLVSFTAVSFLTGILIDKYGTEKVRLIIMIEAFVVMLVISYLYNKYKESDEII